MNDINTVTLNGRLSQDSTLRTLPTGTVNLSFSIAVNEKSKDYEHVNFFNVVLWGKIAESLSKYLVKGKMVTVNGRLKQSRWVDDSDNNRSKVEVIANNVQLIGSKPSQDQNLKDEDIIF